MRAAQPGDVCVILIPSVEELERLRRHLLDLQAVFGGHIVDQVHVTCQRFRPDNPEHSRQAVDGLAAELSRLEPFPLIPERIVTFQSEFWQSSMARWSVQNSPAWHSLTDRIISSLHKLSCAPHYTGDKPTCSALEQIMPEKIHTGETNMELPGVLFIARQAQFSRIDGSGKFTILKTAALGSVEP